MGDLGSSLQLHAFGPPVAAGLLAWSVVSWRRGRLPPWPAQARWPAPLAIATTAALLLYWLLRLGLGAFPDAKALVEATP